MSRNEKWGKDWLRRLSVVLAALAMVSPVFAQEPEVEDDLEAAKAIYVQSEAGKSPKQGVKFNILLKDGQQKVSTARTFQPGEKMLFQLEVSKPSYVYVINRTINTPSSTSAQKYSGKAITTVKDEDKKAPAKRTKAGRTKRRASFTVLFPSTAAGTDNKLAPGKAVTVPSGGAFVMDAAPGVEKLYVIASSKPIDIKKYFNPATGKLRPKPSTATAAKGMDDDAEDEDVADDLAAKGEEDDALDLLNKDLEEWADNADVAMAKGDDEEEDEDFAVSKAPAASGKPMMVEVTLKKKAR
jgi:hypothetical protein